MHHMHSLFFEWHLNLSIKLLMFHSVFVTMLMILYACGMLLYIIYLAIYLRLGWPQICSQIIYHIHIVVTECS